MGCFESKGCEKCYCPIEYYNGKPTNSCHFHSTLISDICKDCGNNLKYFHGNCIHRWK